jgi:hypothetical protein
MVRVGANSTYQPKANRGHESIGYVISGLARPLPAEIVISPFLA